MTVRPNQMRAKARQFISHKLVKMAVIGAAAIGMSSVGVLPAKAFFFLDPMVQSQFEHLMECKHLLFTDPQAHAENCGSGIVGSGILGPGSIHSLIQIESGGYTNNYAPSSSPPSCGMYQYPVMVNGSYVCMAQTN